MTYLEHIAQEKLAREDRVGLAYRWFGALTAGAALSLILLTLA
jgi:hypothetical protein